MAIYGALSTPSGQVRVRWEVEEASAPSVRLVWKRAAALRNSAVLLRVRHAAYRVRFSRELAGRGELTMHLAVWFVEIVAPLGSVS